MTVFKAFKSILRNRVVIFLILLTFMYILSVYYSENYLTHEKTSPSAENFLLNYPEGKNVGLGGTVVKIHKGGFELYVFHHGKDSIFEVNSDSNVSLYNNVTIFGSLENNTIKATKVLLYENWMFKFELLISFFGFLILFLTFLRYWRLDLKNWEIIRR